MKAIGLALNNLKAIIDVYQIQEELILSVRNDIDKA